MKKREGDGVGEGLRQAHTSPDILFGVFFQFPSEEEHDQSG